MPPYILMSLLLLVVSCNGLDENKIENTNSVPKWSRNVVWYQIFPERFRNGDPSNDPTPRDMLMTFPENIPTSWNVTKWGSDWYKEDTWMDDLEEMDFNSKMQLRRYGGDLQGVLDKIDYLDSLGITGVYFNPLNDAPSLHKYDPRHWRHIDRNFGPDPTGDVALMTEENPIDPDTWQWTAADKMFLEVINQFHERGIKVILDFSWNHTGYDFWAVNDIRTNGSNSAFKDWYEVKQFDDPATQNDETDIEGWWGFKYLPLIKEKVENEELRLPHEGNVGSESFKQHIFNVSERWLDPNGDGDFGDGVDGFRLDVATEMTLGWWREYTAFVKSANPEALLVAEAWWFDWPDLTGPEKMINEGHFDALMNYRWFVLSSGLFKQSNPALKPSEFVAWYDSLVVDIEPQSQQAMMNIVATHDTPRLSTMLFNENRFDQGSKLAENSTYKVHQPDEGTWNLLKMYLLHQYTFVGSPHIWNGDEIGMWGANDPDERKPIWWDDIQFEEEKAHPYGERIVPPDEVKANRELLAFYKQMIRMRTQNPVFALGSIEYFLMDDERMLFGYSRKLGDEEALALFNLSDRSQTVGLEVSYTKYIDALNDKIYERKSDQIRVRLNGGEGKILLRSVE
ncbi:MAG: alpha-amylase family glycosyl hydrolase [Ekhidna sp.]